MSGHAYATSGWEESDDRAIIYYSIKLLAAFTNYDFFFITYPSSISFGFDSSSRT